MRKRLLSLKPFYFYLTVTRIPDCGGIENRRIEDLDVITSGITQMQGFINILTKEKLNSQFRKHGKLSRFDLFGDYYLLLLATFFSLISLLSFISLHANL